MDEARTTTLSLRRLFYPPSFGGLPNSIRERNRPTPLDLVILLPQMNRPYFFSKSATNSRGLMYPTYRFGYPDVGSSYADVPAPYNAEGCKWNRGVLT
jgi:hypothetical protein